MVAPNTTGGYNAGYIASKKKKTLNPTIGGGYQAGYIQPASTFDSKANPYAKKFNSLADPYAGMTRKMEGFDSKANPYAGITGGEDYYAAMGLVKPEGNAVPPPPPPVDSGNPFLGLKKKVVDSGNPFLGLKPTGDGTEIDGGVSTVVDAGDFSSVDNPYGTDGTQTTVSSVDPTIRERLIEQAKTTDRGVLNDPHYANLSDADKALIRRYLGIVDPAPPTPEPTPEPIVPASGPVGTPTAEAQAVDGLGNATKQASQAAALTGFDDANVRRSQENLLRTLLGESEDLGRQAVANLDLPTFERGPLEGTLESFLMGQMNQGFTGDDAITQANLADFNAEAEKARAQQIEDLQRFGVLGDGVSSGSVADILGEFDAGVTRGRGALRAEGQRNLLNSILPNAQSLAQFQGAQQSRNREFEAGYNLDRLRAQQEVADRSLARRMPLTDPTGMQVFQESVRQQGLANDRADRGLDMQLAELLGVTSEGRQTLGAQQLGQQDRQFLASLGLDRDRLDESMRQFDAQNRLAEGELIGQLDGQATLADRQLGFNYQQLGQQDRQFLASLGLDRDRLGESARQFDAQNRLAEGELIGQLDGQATLADRQLGFNYQQLSQQDRQFLSSLGLDERQIELAEQQAQQQAERDRIAMILAARDAGYGNLLTGVDVERTLAEMLGVPYGGDSGETDNSTTTDNDAIITGDDVTGSKAIGAKDIIARNDWVNVFVGDNQIVTATGQVLANWDNDGKQWKKA